MTGHRSGSYQHRSRCFWVRQAFRLGLSKARGYGGFSPWGCSYLRARRASLEKQIIWDWIDAVGVSGVDVLVVFVLFADGIVCYVEKLIVEVFDVPDAMLVIAAVPDCSCGVFAGGKRISAFDELNAFRS